MTIHPFSIPHDARDPGSYQIESADTRIGTVTDLGYFDDSIVKKMRANRIRGRKHHIIIVAEGVGNAQDVADRIHTATGIDARVTILGHVQRGGSPTVRDRVMASRMGYHAVKILVEGKSNRVVCARNNEITDYDIEEGLNMSKDLNQELYEVAQTISI